MKKSQFKSVKSVLKAALNIANMQRDELKGYAKLTESEYRQLGEIRAEVQNWLSEVRPLLQKYNIEYESTFN